MAIKMDLANNHSCLHKNLHQRSLVVLFYETPDCVQSTQSCSKSFPPYFCMEVICGSFSQFCIHSLALLSCSHVFVFIQSLQMDEVLALQVDNLLPCARWPASKNRPHESNSKRWDPRVALPRYCAYQLCLVFVSHSHCKPLRTLKLAENRML
jgi:hypothetical protein